MTDPFDTPVADVMTAPVRTLSGGRPAREAATVIDTEDIGSVVVPEGPGVVTKTDVVRAVSEEVDLGATTVEELMSAPVHTVAPGDDLQTVVDRMEAHGVKRLLVTDRGEPVGIVTTSDLARALSSGVDTVVGTFVGPGRADPPFVYECRRCGTRVTAPDRPEGCPDCDGPIQNISVPRD